MRCTGKGVGPAVSTWRVGAKGDGKDFGTWGWTLGHGVVFCFKGMDAVLSVVIASEGFFL